MNMHTPNTQMGVGERGLRIHQLAAQAPHIPFQDLKAVGSIDLECALSIVLEVVVHQES